MEWTLKVNLNDQSFSNLANTCLVGGWRKSSLASGLLSTGKAWRSVNNMQLEVPPQSSDVTRHTGLRGGDVTRLTETMRRCLASVCTPVCLSHDQSVCRSIGQPVRYARSGGRFCFYLAWAKVGTREKWQLFIQVFKGINIFFLLWCLFIPTFLLLFKTMKQALVKWLNLFFYFTVSCNILLLYTTSHVV